VTVYASLTEMHAIKKDSTIMWLTKEGFIV